MSTCPEGHSCMTCSVKAAVAPLANLSRHFAAANRRRRYIDSSWAPALGPGVDVVVQDRRPEL